MSYGVFAWAALMAALAFVYLRGMRSGGLTGKRMVHIALIWVAIIGGGFLIVRAVTGIQ